jgi:hypothetical protein
MKAYIYIYIYIYIGRPTYLVACTGEAEAERLRRENSKQDLMRGRCEELNL